ncbi:MAG: molybdopterin-dependent oxidoreductase [Myxococcales bacterium]
MTRPSRRDLLRFGLLSSLASRVSFAGPPAPGFIVRNERPLDLETEVSVFTEEFTPNELFFVRSHFGAPVLDLANWRLRIEGLVEHPVALTLGALRKLTPSSAPVALQCAGNGRSLFRPKVAGAQWARGAVGQALWRGVRLAEVLDRAGVKPEARFVTFIPGDHPLGDKVPPFNRSIPIEKARKDVLLAWEMNHQPLAVLHGAPLRAVVPGWAGDHWVKWLRGIRVEAQEDQGFYMQTGYKIPTEPMTPGGAPKAVKSLTALPVKSIIARPLAGAVLKPGRVEVRGVAFGGAGAISKVELSVDGGANWSAASVAKSRGEGAWQLFSGEVVLQVGANTIHVRATDSNGESQPREPLWNPGGYLYNAWDAVRCEVRS